MARTYRLNVRRVRVAMETSGLSITDLAASAGICEKNLARRLLKGKPGFSATIRKIAVALQLPFEKAACVEPIDASTTRVVTVVFLGPDGNQVDTRVIRELLGRDTDLVN